MSVDPVANSLLHLFSAISGTSPLQRSAAASRTNSPNTTSAPTASDIISRLPKDSVELSPEALAASYADEIEGTNSPTAPASPASVQPTPADTAPG